MQENPITELSKFFKNIDYDRLINNAGLTLDFIKRQAMTGSKETARIMLELYYVMVNENTSKFNKLIIGSALAYQLLPNDILSKEDYGVLGYLDNATALYMAYKRIKKNVTPEIRKKVDETLDNWKKSAKEFTIMKPEGERV
ncbi:MAG: DUF1232 domain-containing protein [Bacteroidaceae bacterium]|nr:DUF1232 domain-containing protein [Bacteroidaceae bacterium]